MKGMQRRKEILAMIRQEGSLAVGDIARRFEVSKMTVHRDLEQLESRGMIRRIFGGAVSLEEKETPVREGEEAAGTAAAGKTPGKEVCMICFRPVATHLFYCLTLGDGERHCACCAHCGISAHLLFGDKVRMALTADYISGKLHSVQNSHFLMGSAAEPCCHPSILTFEQEEMARRFQTGFGGRLGRLADAVSFLQSDLLLNKGEEPTCPKCAGRRE